MLTLFTISIIAVGAIGFSQSQAAPQHIPERQIIILHDDANPWSVANEMAQQRGLSVSHVYETAVNGFSGIVPPGQLDKIASDPRVKYIEQDSIVSISAKGGVPGKPGGGGGGEEDPIQPDQDTPTGISAINGPGFLGSYVVNVAVIDTGIDPNHSDLNVVGGKNFASGKSYKDGNGHGTHVAGTIGAKDNSFGVIGVAPGVNLYAVRVLNNAGSGWMSDVIAGVDWVKSTRENGNPNDDIDVANMSLGGSYSTTLNNAVNSAIDDGVVFVVAGGNSSTDACTKSPASAADAITVSALDDRNGDPTGDPIASFSNDGSCIDMIAPGVLILSTWKGNGYNTISGTSMASPHVAGAAALYLSHNAVDPDAVTSALLANGDNTIWNTASDTDGIAEPFVLVS